MANVTNVKCDGCGKVVENRCAEKDWVSLTHGSINPVAVIVYKGKYNKKTGCYESHYREGVSDFCSWRCLIEFMKKQPTA